MRRPGPPEVETATTPGRLSLLVIGVSGLEGSVIDRLMEQDRLPNLAALATAGAAGQFETLPRGTDPRIVWTSLVTGVSPENQGIGGKTMSPRGDLIDAALIPASRTVDTIWTVMNEQGESCAVLGWPGTWPAEELNGLVVVPHTTYVLERTHGGRVEELVYPVSAHEMVDPLMIDPGEITRRDLSRFINMDSALGLEALIGQNYIALAKAYAADRSVADLARHATSSTGVSSVLVCLAGIDAVSQRFWHYMDPEAIRQVDTSEDERRVLEGQVVALGGTVEAYYEFVDELVGELAELAGENATIAVVGDHGYAGVMLDEAGLPKVGSFMHREQGVFMLGGPRVVPGARAEGVSILDVAPTVMAASSIPLPADVEGDVLSALLEL
jgi:predicted AlkP superfamily phosphohydrolase/phosphomutase